MIILICLCILLMIIWYRDTRIVKRHDIKYHVSSLKRPLRLVQLTDLHGHMFKGKLDTLFNLIKNDTPDLIVLTGDMIDRHTTHIDETVRLIQKLTTLAPVYAVLGNHEVGHPKQAVFLDQLKKIGVTTLINTHVVLDWHDRPIQIVGVNDHSSEQANLLEAFSGVKHAPFTILLSHSPSIVDDLTTEPAQLILCGHTHGGQIRLPLIGALISPGEGIFPKRTKGMFNLSSERALYIDSGLGMSRLPIRLFNQSQYTVFYLGNERNRAEKPLIK